MLDFALRILLWECETKIGRRAHKITNEFDECAQICILRVGTQLRLMLFLKVQVRLTRNLGDAKACI